MIRLKIDEKKVVSVCLIDSDWKGITQKQQQQQQKKLHSSISKWSFFLSLFFSFHFIPLVLLTIEWKMRCEINIYCFDWKSQKIKLKEINETMCWFFVVFVDVAVALFCILRHAELIEFHKVDEFWAICCGPSIRNRHHHIIAQLHQNNQYWTHKYDWKLARVRFNRFTDRNEERKKKRWRRWKSYKMKIHLVSYVFIGFTEQKKSSSLWCILKWILN